MTSGTASKRCVIADDTRAPRVLVAQWLRDCCFHCVQAKNGQEAWESICQSPPDLLITDVEMPELGGLDLLKRIRRAESLCVNHLPVLVMTSLHDGKTLDTVKSLGGNGLLHKPLDRQPTLSVVLNLVARKNELHHVGDPDERVPTDRPGIISPTLRRLMDTVAGNSNRSSSR